jgi:hypothetical protein
MDLYNFLLIIYFIFFLGLAIKNLKWAIYWIIFCLPSYLIRFQFWGLPMTVLEVMILMVFLVWIFKNKIIQEYKNTKIRKDTKNNKGLLFLYYFIFIFLLAATVAVFVSPNLRAAAGIWKAYFIEPILFLIVLVNLV